MSEKVLYKHSIEVHNTRASDIIIPIVFKYLEVKSVVDIGCGIGTWLNSVENLGIKDILGIDGNYINKDQLLINLSNFIPADLSKPFVINRRFDLVISLEVAEHIHIESSDIFIESLAKLSDNILFSAATVGQGGQNHVNEQPISYWKQKFENFGYKFYDIIRPLIWDNENVDVWYKQNIFIASKNDIVINKFELPEIINIVHPELYKLRTTNLENIKNKLSLKPHEYDNLTPVLDSQIINFIKWLNIFKIRKN